MRFMMLIHHDESALTPDVYKELATDYGAFMEALAKAEGCAAGERLQSSTLATTVRQHDGKTEVLDGPYADTKEQLAGYFVVDVASLDEAITWAKRCPSSRFGSVEIRPMLNQPGSKS